MKPIAIEVLKEIMKDRKYMTYDELEFNSKVVSYICNLFNISEDEEDILWIELFEKSSYLP